jgi:signal transduction histidine kinase/CheY-like chemotaxis protein
VHRPDIPRISYSREEFRGYISGAYRISGILGSVLNEANDLNFGFRIHDVTGPGIPQPLIFSETPPLLQLSVYHKKLRFGERTWDVEFYANQSYQLASKDWASWLIIVGGFFAAAMWQAFIMMITGSEARVFAEVERKTRDLAKAMKLAEEANKAKSNFLANMSHEFRTPLNAIIGLVNLCRKTSLTSKQQGYLEKTSQASETLLLLINHTLDYSKIEAGKLELELADFSLAAMLKKIHSIFWVKASQQNVGFSIELPSSLPALLKGDSLRLEQVLLNLCSNAFKFTQQGAVTLIVALDKDEKFARVRFTVQDTGIGISAENKLKLFESFQQADASTSRRFGGTGLGLSISRQLVELMGGEISVTSELGQGSSFSFQLDFERETQAEIDTAELSQLFSAALSSELNAGDEANLSHFNIVGGKGAEVVEDTGEKEDVTSEISKGASDDKPLSGRSILLVEDVEVNQIIAEEVLKEFGASVTIAENGLKAVDAVLSEQAFDLVLMDIQMPEMDGYTATRRIREEGYVNLPIVAMTANAMTSDIEKCQASGMNDHIPKPIDEEVMLAKILANLPHKS